MSKGGSTTDLHVVVSGIIHAKTFHCPIIMVPSLLLNKRLGINNFTICVSVKSIKIDYSLI